MDYRHAQNPGTNRAFRIRCMPTMDKSKNIPDQLKTSFNFVFINEFQDFTFIDTNRKQALKMF